MSGYCFRLAKDNPMISWKSKKQNSVTLSICKVESIAISLASQVALYLRGLLRTVTELGSLKHPTIHWDNQSSTVLTKKPVIHQISIHIDIKFQFIPNEINKGCNLLIYIETEKKCSWHVYEANDKNKIKYFHKGYSGHLVLT